MAKPSRFEELLATVSEDVTLHPRDLTRQYAERFGISRVAANRYVQRLEAEGWIARSGTATHPVFSLGYRRRVRGQVPLAGLEEFAVWDNKLRPYLNLTPNVQNIVAHGFTEMLNNAIDHSGGSAVRISVSQDEREVQVILSDDGVGIFRKLTDALKLPDLRLARLELAKGKLTTDPSRHSGEGVFFTSRMFDSFVIVANGLKFSHDANAPEAWLEESGFSPMNGTTVAMRMSLASARTAAEIYAQFTNPPEDFDFSRTVVPMRMAVLGDELLISRSQAKRLTAGFDRFKTVVLDFTQVQEVGQAFADEVFRVYALANPQLELIPKNMSEQVERMWLRAVAPRMS